MNPGVMPNPSGIVPSQRAGRVEVVYCPLSAVVEAPFAALVRVRAMGAGGSGASSATAAGAPSGGNGASVAYAEVFARKGDKFTVTLGAGGAAVTTAVGNPGSQTTITGPNGFNGIIPGANGGVLAGAQPANNSPPTGFQQYWLGGLGGKGTAFSSGGGGSAPLLNGTTKGFDGGDGAASGSNNWGGGAGVNGKGGTGAALGPGSGGGSGGPGSGGTAPVPGGLNLGRQAVSAAAFANESHSRVLVNVSGGGAESVASGVAPVAGPGGGGAGTGGNAAGGAGGFGGGGSGGYSPGGAGGAGGGGGSGNNGPSGPGGQAYVTLEFVEIL